jgi:hypothetical protein
MNDREAFREIRKNERLRRLRYKRTRAINVVRASMEHLLSEPAKWDQSGRLVEPGFIGLPSWWSFWSDVLKDNVREAVRAALELQAAEERS